MKQSINEIKRMQQLAGLITESYTNEVRSGDTVTFKKGRTHHLGKIDGKDYQIIPVNHIVGDRIKVINWEDSNDFLIGIIKSIDGNDYEVEITNNKDLEEGVDEGIGKALGTAALGAALAFGSPKTAAAQSPQEREQTAQAKLSDEETGYKLWHAYSEHRSTVNLEKLSSRVFDLIADIDPYNDLSSEDAKKIGRAAKKDPAAMEIVNKSEASLRNSSQDAIKAAKMKKIDETVNEALKRFRRSK
jgi:hypothetical protein